MFAVADPSMETDRCSSLTSQASSPPLPSLSPPHFNCYTITTSSSTTTSATAEAVTAGDNDNDDDGSPPLPLGNPNRIIAATVVRPKNLSPPSSSHKKRRHRCAVCGDCDSSSSDVSTSTGTGREVLKTSPQTRNNYGDGISGSVVPVAVASATVCKNCRIFFR